MRTIAFLKALFTESSHERIFLVGGVVRDVLLGQDCKDIDLVAALTADELTAFGFHLVKGKSTAPIWFRSDKAFGKIEVSLLTDVAGLAADLAQRDFTINALAMSLSGELIDPLGGKMDLEQGRLRACSPNSFLHDPLRIFRAFRFEADGWRMTPESEALIREQEWAHWLADIPVERFSREMLKAFEAPEPERFFQRMLEFKVGDKFLPEIFHMPHIIAGPQIYHPEGDLFTHSIQVLHLVAQQSNDPLARFCAVFHDIGKLATNPADYPKHHGHDLAGFDLARSFCDRLRLPASYRTALAWTSRLHGKFNRWTELRITTRIKVADQALKAGIVSILPLVSLGDKGKATDLQGWDRAIQVARMTAAELGIDLAQLEATPVDSRSEFILQRRVERLRRLL